MDTTAKPADRSRPPVRRPFRAGPSPALLAGLSLVLLIGGIVTSAVLGGTFPSPFAAPSVVADHFVREPDAVHAAAVFTVGSALPLALLAGTVSSRLRSLGSTAPWATIALVGGVSSAVLLTLSGLLGWVLSRAEVRADTPLVHALHDLSFLTGGVAHVIFLGLLIAGVAVPGLLMGLLPRWLAIGGTAIAAVAELAAVSLIWDGAAVLLPIARFPGLVWLIVAGILLRPSPTSPTGG